MVSSHISALGGLLTTVVAALAIAAWLVGARCWRLALAWCALFGGAMLVALASQVAFIGWGAGVQSLDFTGFSGHATRAGAVYPVLGFLLLERRPGRHRTAGIVAGLLVAALVAWARVRVGAHSPAEAVAGLALGVAAALLFVARARANRRSSRKPLLVGGLALAALLLPRSEPVNTHQWVTSLALALSGHDRPYLRETWQPAPWVYVPPCSAAEVRFGYFCT